MIEWMRDNPELAAWAQFLGAVIGMGVAIAAPYLQINAQRASAAAALSESLSMWLTHVVATEAFFKGELLADQSDLNRLRQFEAVVRAFPQSTLSPVAIVRLQEVMLYASIAPGFLLPLGSAPSANAASAGLEAIEAMKTAWRALGRASPEVVRGVDASWLKRGTLTQN